MNALPPVARTLAWSAAFLATATTTPLIGAPLPPAHFREHTIETNIPGGYRVLITDLNRDGRPDVIGLSGRGAELFWYENPTWKRHVLAKGMHSMISVAAADLNSDGIPELALATHFGQTESSSEGRLYRLEHQGDPREPWKATEFDRLPTSHRLRFADIDGDGHKELINSPLTGRGAQSPLFECRTPLVYYRPREWQRHVIYEDLDGVVHGMNTVHWDRSGREAVLTTSFGGVWMHQASPSKATGQGIQWDHHRVTPGDPAERPKSGASEIQVGKLRAGRFFTTIEPWHGNQVVIYTRADEQQTKQPWNRRVIDRSLQDGHALQVADFNGDGTDEVVAGFRGEGASVYIYYAEDSAATKWRREDLDSGGMAAAGCDVADLNSDGQLDVVCIGSRTANIKWYENQGSESAAPPR